MRTHSSIGYRETHFLYGKTIHFKNRRRDLSENAYWVKVSRDVYISESENLMKTELRKDKNVFEIAKKNVCVVIQNEIIQESGSSCS